MSKFAFKFYKQGYKCIGTQTHLQAKAPTSFNEIHQIWLTIYNMSQKVPKFTENISNIYDLGII